MTNETRTPSPLLPCPFCGSTDLEIRAGCYVRCRGCVVEGTVFDDQPDDDAEAKIAALWNTRTPSPDAPGSVAGAVPSPALSSEGLYCAGADHASASRSRHGEGTPADGCKHRPFVRYFGGVPGVECFDCRERLPDDFTPADYDGIMQPVDPADFIAECATLHDDARELVERLREEKVLSRDAQGNTLSCTRNPDGTEAADLIEQLLAELADAVQAGEKIGRAKGRASARKVSQRHAKHGARL